MTPEAMGVVIGVLLVAALVILITVTRNLYVCSPSEVLIFSGVAGRRPTARRWASAWCGAGAGCGCRSSSWSTGCS